MPQNPSQEIPVPNRIGSIDAYRGMVMFLMLAEVLHLCRVSEALPESGFWKFLCFHQSHVPWVGCSLHDLIQPSFSFLVGVALPFSIAARIGRGQSIALMTGHAMWRALVLVGLGIFLRSIGKPQTYFTFEDTLTQIGLGYPFLFLLGLKKPRTQWIAFGSILFLVWLAFALYPLPGSPFPWEQSGANPDWEHNLAGFAGHWNKNTNLAWAFDTWFLNLFPRASEFTHNGGGYATLSFIPTLGTMILGLIAGGWIKAGLDPERLLKRLFMAGILGLALGWILGVTGICPVVKRIWTPSWTLFSGGWCCLILAGFYALIDYKKKAFWAFPLTIIGMNSIAAYCSEWLFVGFIRRSFKTHLGESYPSVFGVPYASLVEGGLVLLVLWLMLYWMFRKRIFIRI